MSSAARLARAAAGGLAVLGLAACAPTTYDSELVATTTIAVTTTVPTGTAAELLPRMVAEGQSIGTLMVAEGDAKGALERLTALWQTVRAEVAASRPDLIDGFDQQIDRFQRAVQYKRAADADKSARNLVVLVDAYLG
ncbi:MAG: hypothetical protein KGR47_13420 [Acidobacteria bacterium]|nr:hypothetical protein [Acidobacteriota bacterium]